MLRTVPLGHLGIVLVPNHRAKLFLVCRDIGYRPLQTFSGGDLRYSLNGDQTNYEKKRILAVPIFDLGIILRVYRRREKGSRIPTRWYFRSKCKVDISQKDLTSGSRRIVCAIVNPVRTLMLVTKSESRGQHVGNQ
jgi:hypothetical protein